MNGKSDESARNSSVRIRRHCQSSNRQFSRRLKREMQKPSKRQEDFKHVSIRREFSKENYLASLDALSPKEQNELARAQRAKIIKKASKD